MYLITLLFRHFKVFNLTESKKTRMSELKEFQKLLIANASGAKVLLLGDTAPDFTLLNAFGENVSVSQPKKKV